MSKVLSFHYSHLSRPQFLHFHIFLHTDIGHSQILLSFVLNSKGVHIDLRSIGGWHTNNLFFLGLIEVKILLGSSEISHTFEIIGGILFSLGCALSPGCFRCAGHTAIIAHILIFLFKLGIVQKIFNFKMFFLEEIFELCEVANPFGFNCIVITGKSPC